MRKLILFLFHSTITLFILGVLLVLTSCGSSNDKVFINDKFPLREGSQLAPPIVHEPVFECAKAVHVSGYIPHAKITVIANGVDTVGKGKPEFAETDIVLTRPLVAGETVRATQTVNGMTSAPSIHPVKVQVWGGMGLSKPLVSQDIYDCGIIVPVGNLNPSTVVYAFENSGVIGSRPNAGNWQPVSTTALHAGQKVTAQQVVCEDDPSRTLKSPVSDPVVVKTAPNPVPSPVVDAQNLIPGNDKVLLWNLLTGARITIYDKGKIISDYRYATGGGNWCPVDVPISSTSEITAVQTLCDIPSKPSDPTKPAGELKAPELVGPICPNAKYFIIQETTINATVVVLRGGVPIAYGGAKNGDLVLGFKGSLAPGDVLTVIQYMGSNISPLSLPVTVGANTKTVVVETLGGEPFFKPEASEIAIDGSVFPRGTGLGVVVRVRSCCLRAAPVQITTPTGNQFSVSTTEIMPGLFEAIVPWSKFASSTSKIPVGEYQIRVPESNCGEREGKAKFYVIFDPAEVSGPPRFSFNETGIWFGVDFNSSIAFVYYLHPDDRRVFEKSIGVINGLTDQSAAAQKIFDMETSLFAYDLLNHGNDIIKLLTTSSFAQCVDDANMLTALLRTVGIPAHPATVDASLEDGQAIWTFDTWTEVLLPTAGKPEWLIYHPHEYPNMTAPETRGFFGASGVATKSNNDIVIMANENWTWSEVSDGISDVTWIRQACGEPEEILNKASWIDELCENGYWGQPHWQCASIQPLTVEHTENPLRINLSNAGYGRNLLANLRIPEKMRTAATNEDVYLELVGDDLRSKRFPDSVFLSRRFKENDPTLDWGKIGTQIDLPRSVLPGVKLYLLARKNKNLISLQPIALSNALELKISLPTQMTLAQQATALIEISNISKVKANEVALSLELPYGLMLNKESILPKSISLNPGESKKILVALTAISPMEAAMVRVTAYANLIGNADLQMPIMVFPSSSDANRTLINHKKR